MTVVLVIMTPIAANSDIVVGSATTCPMTWSRRHDPYRNECAVQRRCCAGAARAPDVDHLQLRCAVDQYGALHSDLDACVGADGLGHELVAGADHDSDRQHHRARPYSAQFAFRAPSTGIPFPVFARAAYGTLGSNVPALMRALVACGSLAFRRGSVARRFTPRSRRSFRLTNLARARTGRPHDDGIAVVSSEFDPTIAEPPFVLHATDYT